MFSNHRTSFVTRSFFSW